MSATPFAAAASEISVADVARDVLSRGNAVDAVVSAVLYAAAQAPGVLLGPVQILVGGAGAGLRAVDGRARQPGKGIPRPRGAVAGEAIPPTARVAVSALPAALAAALAAVGSISQARASAPAVERAKELSPERAAVLKAFAQRGAPAFADDVIGSELVALAGRSVGGALTKEDLSEVRPEVVACDEREIVDGLLRTPWGSGVASTQTTQVVVAADRRGLLAVACYEAALDGLNIPALGLLAPSLAAPVLRGEARLRPGAVLPAAAPIALRLRGSIVELAAGVGGAAGDALDLLLSKLDDEGMLQPGALAEVPGRPVAIVRSRENARVIVG